MKSIASLRGTRVVVRESNPVATANWLLDHGARVVIASKKDDAAMRRIEEHLQRIARDGASYEHLRARLTWKPDARASSVDVNDIFFSEWRRNIIAITGRHGKTMAVVWAGHLIGDAVVAGHAPERSLLLALDSRAKIAVVEMHGAVPDAQHIHVVNTNTMSARDAAVRAAQLAGISEQMIQKRLATLPQIPLRQEVMHESGKLTVVNDAMATLPERGIPALQKFGAPNCILIAGGTGTKGNYRSWAREVSERILKTNIILVAGSATRAIQKAFGYLGMRNIRTYDTLDECWAVARTRAKHFVSATILFSPAAKTP